MKIRSTILLLISSDGLKYPAGIIFKKTPSKKM